MVLKKVFWKHQISVATWSHDVSPWPVPTCCHSNSLLPPDYFVSRTLCFFWFPLQFLIRTAANSWSTFLQFLKFPFRTGPTSQHLSHWPQGFALFTSQTYMWQNCWWPTVLLPAPSQSLYIDITLDLSVVYYDQRWWMFVPILACFRLFNEFSEYACRKREHFLFSEINIKSILERILKEIHNYIQILNIRQDL